jgi:hypothetical protein
MQAHPSDPRPLSKQPQTLSHSMSLLAHSFPQPLSHMTYITGTEEKREEKREEILASMASPSSLFALLRRIGRLHSLFSHNCRFSLKNLREFQFTGILLALAYWKTSPENLHSFNNLDENDEEESSSGVNSSSIPMVVEPAVERRETQYSMLQQLIPRRVCRLSIPCGGGKTAMIVWLCALRGGNILLGTDCVENAMNILKVIVKQTTLAQFMNVKIVRAANQNEKSSKNASAEDAELLRIHGITCYPGGSTFSQPIVDDNSVGNIVIVDSHFMRTLQSGIQEKHTIGAALSLIAWGTMIFDEVDKFFTQEVRKPFDEGFVWNVAGTGKKKFSFCMPYTVMLSGTWRVGEDKNKNEGRLWLKRAGPMLQRIKSIDLSKAGMLATPHIHVVVCKNETGLKKFGFEENFRFGLTLEMVRVIEKIVQMHSLTRGKVMIFNNLHAEVKLLQILFPKAIVVTGKHTTKDRNEGLEGFAATSENNEHPKVYITTSVNARGYDDKEVTAVIRVGGDGCDVTWQEYGRGLRVEYSNTCHIYEIVHGSKFKWAEQWLDHRNDAVIKQTERMRNVVLEGYSDYVKSLDSDDFVASADKEIERVCNLCESPPNANLIDIQDNKFAVANYILSLILGEVSEVSNSSAKSAPKKKQNKSAIHKRLLSKNAPQLAATAAAAAAAALVAATAARPSRGAQPSSSREVPNAWLDDGKRKKVVSILQVIGYPDADTYSMQKLQQTRQDVKEAATTAYNDAHDSIQRLRETISYEYVNGVDCEFISDRFPR